METTFERRDVGLRPVLVVGGEIDLLVADELIEHLHRLIRDAESVAYVDLVEVTFFDATGVNALMRVQRNADRHGIDLTVSPSTCVMATLRLLRLEHAFRLGSPPPEVLVVGVG